jgi:hypothetical protein
VGDFFHFKKREILEFAINKEGKSDIKNREFFFNFKKSF